jgi:hypothetical protein
MSLSAKYQALHLLHRLSSCTFNKQHRNIQNAVTIDESHQSSVSMTNTFSI